MDLLNMRGSKAGGFWTTIAFPDLKFGPLWKPRLTSSYWLCACVDLDSFRVYLSFDVKYMEGDGGAAKV